MPVASLCHSIRIKLKKNKPLNPTQMKNLVLIASFFALILSSCTQELPQMREDIKQEVVFTASTDPNGFKSDPLYDCMSQEASYAMVTLTYGGVGMTPIEVPVFYIDKVMYTQAIKLTPETETEKYRLEEFILYSEDGTILTAAPHAGSDYGTMVANALPVDVPVNAFTKAEVPINLLCYSPSTHKEFGFTWFQMTEHQIRNKFFFGDFCTKFFADYDVESSYYAGKAMVDMPAIFKLNLNKLNADGTAYESVMEFDNILSFESGSPLEMTFVDMVGADDKYRIDISIYVKIGESFGFQNFGSWYFSDEENDVLYTDDQFTQAFTPGDDGVYDFILGNCNVNGADFMFAPYMNLPGLSQTGINMTIGIAEEEGRDSYLTATLSGIGAGYDLGNGTVGAFCFDLGHTINISTTYNDIAIYSSLYPANLPSYMSAKNWGAVNWLANHLNNFSGYTWKEVQQAMWVIEGFNNYQYPSSNIHGVDADESIVAEMVEQALQNGVGYFPMPGGWAAVVLEAGETIQTVFTIVDP